MHRDWLLLGFALAAALGAAAAPASAAQLGAQQALLAYVDPGAGSFVLQALLATLAGAAVVANAYWKKIRRFFGGSSDPKDDESQSER
jgi:hypothetical protein